jgi:hypothetical protein
VILRAYGHARLMQESESRIEMAASSTAPLDRLVTLRLLECPAELSRWEAHHDQLMRPVSAPRRLSQQVVALRATAIALVHRRALFEYLRARRLTETKRRRLIGIFYHSKGYGHAMLAEHGNYVRCSSSYLCTQHLAQHLMHDPALAAPLRLYEEWYRDYFQAYCDLELAETADEKAACLAQECLQTFLKHRVTKARRTILALPLRPGDWDEVKIRQATGDTVKLRPLMLPN